MADEFTDPDYQSLLERARASGYSWGDIQGHIAQSTAEADDNGYSQAEIDQHLGFQDPAAFESRAKASWGTAMADDPSLLDGLAQPTPTLDLGGNPTVESDYATALKGGEVKGPLDFAQRYAAQAIGAAHDIHGLDPADADARMTAAAGAAMGLAQTLPSREDLADAALSVNPDDPAAVRGNLIDNWLGTGQSPVDAATDPTRATALKAPEDIGLLGEAWKGMERAGASTIIGLAHIGEQAFKALANVPGGEGLQGLISEKAAEWKEREDRWNAELKGTDFSQAGVAPTHFVAGVIGQAVPTIAEYVAAGIPAMIAYGVMHGANEAYRETGSAGAAAAGAIIGGAEAGAPVPFLHGAAGRGLIDGAIRGAVGMGVVGGLQTLFDPIPRAIATGEYAPPTWEGVEQGIVEGAIGGAVFGAFGAARRQRAVVVDPSKPPGETNTETTARRALALVQPAEFEAPTEGGPIKFAASSTPAERLERIYQDATPADTTAMRSGTFFQDRLARLDETDPATVELAKGHDTAWASLVYLKNLAGDLFRDTQGSVPPLSEGEREELARQHEAMLNHPREPKELPGGAPRQSEVRAQARAVPPEPTPAPPTALERIQAEQETERTQRPMEPKELPGGAPRKAEVERQTPPAAPFPDNTKANTNVMRDVVIKHQSLGEQNVLHFAGLVDNVRHLLNPHMPEFEEALKGGAPLDTTIGHLMQDMEGRGVATVPGSGGRRYVATLDPNSPLKPVVDLFKTINNQIWLEIQQRVARKQIDAVGYVHDYWRHLWKDPNAAEAAWGAGKQGSNASLKERTIPTIADGLALGLELKIQHPADLMNYDLASKLKYLHHLDLVHELENTSGLIVRSVRAPFPGAEALQGRSMDRITPEGTEHAWAPAGAARLYNRTIEGGWYAYPSTASTYQKLMWLKNTSVGTKLIFPIFHSFVIMEQTLATGFQQMGAELRAGNVGTAAVHFAKTVTIAPKAVEIARAGRAAIKAYADRTGDTVLQGLVESGARYGKRQIPYQTGPRGIIASIQQNQGHVAEALGREIAQEAKATLGQEGDHILERGALFVPRVAGMAINELGRVETTLSAPLFDYTIPTMKAGAGYLRAKQFLDLNPQASEATVKTRLRQIVENIEDRYGEMNQDNLLWNKWLKQTANAASISTSWAYGTWRWLAGAAGYNIERGVEWNPEATSSLVSAAAVYVGANALFNYLNTGEQPQDIWDLLNFRTGGVDKYGRPERGLLPTEFKELYDMGKIAVDGYLDPTSVFKGIAHYFAGKENPAVQIFTALVTGEDALGHKISQTPRGWPGYFEDQVRPIIFDNLTKNPPGSGLNAPERTFIRAAPSWLTATQDYVTAQQKLHDRWTKEELQRAGREAAQAGEPAPEGYIPPHARGNGAYRERAQRDYSGGFAPGFAAPTRPSRRDYSGGFTPPRAAPQDYQNQPQDQNPYPALATDYGTTVLRGNMPSGGRSRYRGRQVFIRRGRR